LSGAALATVLLSQAAHASRDFTVPATPPGVTMEPAIKAAAMQAGLPMTASQSFFADADGMTLYTYGGDADGKSACTGDCAQAWPALTAPGDAKPVGDWTVIARDDGSRQWAYKGRPLYRFAKDAKPGDAGGIGVAGPADGSVWRVAAIDQAPDQVVSPASITLHPMPRAGGDVFVDAKGMTLYVYDGDIACTDACLESWTPLKAAELAKPIGDWTILRRDDGARQWAYKGRPLYSFMGDAKPGDVNGQFADSRWHAAALHGYFMPPEVTLRLNGNGVVLADAAGRALYARDRFRFSFGGYSVNDGPPATSVIGRAVGTAGCAGECTQTWKPLAAPAGAEASGFWTIAQRADGTRQWAYQGYPLYTNVNDSKAGDMAGRDQFDLTDGSHALIWRLALP
jgi:predicted lipoprotein with Yx(FWY)xxD motif